MAMKTQHGDGIVSVYTKIWEEERGNSKLLGLCHQGIDWMRISNSGFRCNVRIGYFMDDVSRRRQWAILEWRQGDVSDSINKENWGPSYY